MTAADFTPEQAMLRETARRVAREVVAPRAAALDEEGVFPRDLQRRVGDEDYGYAGITAFFVETAWPGFAVTRHEWKMGIRGSTNVELTFDDLRVPVENRLGEEGEGFRLAMQILDRNRPPVGAIAMGLAQGALDYKSVRLVDRDDPAMATVAAMAKCFASDVAMKVTTDAVQVLGGYGHMKDYPGVVVARALLEGRRPAAGG